MKCHLDCVACLVRQALKAARLISDDPEVHKNVLRHTLEAAAQMNFDDPPPLMARHIQHALREFTGCADPYLSVKREFNGKLMERLEDFRSLVDDSPKPFNTAVRLAIAGNIVDFATFSHIDDAMIQDAINRSLSAPIADEAIKRVEDEIQKARSILYLVDNAGEIVFDRLLIERMPLEKISLVVKGGPIINDALIEDAREVGLTDMVEVVDNGSEAAGTVLDTCSDDFLARFNAADMIISKGQANFETLNEVDANIFFLFTAKCPVVASETGCKLGDMIVRAMPQTMVGP